MLSNSLHKVEEAEKRCSSRQQLQGQRLGPMRTGLCESCPRRNGITERREPQTPPVVFHIAPALLVLEFATSGSFSHTWCIFDVFKDLMDTSFLNTRT